MATFDEVESESTADQHERNPEVGNEYPNRLSTLANANESAAQEVDAEKYHQDICSGQGYSDRSDLV